MSKAKKNWLKLSIDVHPAAKKRQGDRLRWKGTLVLTGFISGYEFNVPIANCRAEVDLQPPPLGRDVLLGIVASAVAMRSPIPDRVQGTLIALRDHLKRLPKRKEAARRRAARASRPVQ